jgi:solute carrier family 25 protein 34/35
MIRIARTEGIWALQRGLRASCAHQIAQNGTRLGAYPALKRTIEDLTGGKSVALNVAAGAAAGAMGAVVSSPFFLIKTRLQAQSAAPEGHKVGVQHNYSGVMDGLRKVHRDRGVRGLFHGCKAAVWRTTVGSAAQLATYDKIKEEAARTIGMTPVDVRLHFVAAAGAALAITVAMNPFDVIMTRCYNNDAHGYSSRPLHAFRQVIAVEGVSGLYKGSLALWSRTAPHTITTFVVLEQMHGVFRALTWEQEMLSITSE